MMQSGTGGGCSFVLHICRACAHVLYHARMTCQSIQIQPTCNECRLHDNEVTKTAGNGSTITILYICVPLSWTFGSITWHTMQRSDIVSGLDVCTATRANHAAITAQWTVGHCYPCPHWGRESVMIRLTWQTIQTSDGPRCRWPSQAKAEKKNYVSKP